MRLTSPIGSCALPPNHPSTLPVTCVHNRTTLAPPAAAVIVNRQKRLPRRATRLHDKRRVMNRAWKERGGGRRGICPPYHCSLLKVQCAPLNSRLPAPHLAKIQLHSLNSDAQAGAHRKNRRSVGRSEESPNNSTGSSKINGAKFSDACSVRAYWLCMGWPFCLAEMRREFLTGGKIFCTTL